MPGLKQLSRQLDRFNLLTIFAYAIPLFLGALGDFTNPRPPFSFPILVKPECHPPPTVDMDRSTRVVERGGETLTTLPKRSKRHNNVLATPGH